MCLFKINSLKFYKYWQQLQRFLLFSMPLLAMNHAYGLSCSTTNTVWNNGYLVLVEVTNDGASPVDSWSVNLVFSQGHGINNSWGANIDSTTDIVVAENLAWNGKLMPGNRANFGFTGTHTGSFSGPSCVVSFDSSSVASSDISSAASSSSSVISSSLISSVPQIASSSSSAYSRHQTQAQSSTAIFRPPYPSIAPPIGGATNLPMPTMPPLPDIPEPDIDSESTYFYLSYDDSASTAPRDITFAALEYGRLPSTQYGRPYEFLNAETFEHFAKEDAEPFTVSMGLVQVVNKEIPVAISYEGEMYALGININGPTLTQTERKNVVLTLLLDISGSMSSSYASETRLDLKTLLDVAKSGLKAVLQSLKPGDKLNLVTFDTHAEVVMTDWLYNPDDSTYLEAVEALYTRGTTNLNEGIELAYDVARRSYDETKANRVIIMTDAYANTGMVDPEIIAENTVINGMEGILFSGIGIGASFNETFLNELTDIGKSTYSSMVTPEDANRIFTDGFMRFVDHAVENIQFRIDYPQSLDQLKSAAEQISTDINEVTTVNYAYNSSQFFLELFNSIEGTDGDENITLTITFDGEDGETETRVLEKTVSELLSVDSTEIYAAAMVTTLADLVAGKIECEAVLSSDLYTMSLSSEVYRQYQKAIEMFCNLQSATPTPIPLPEPSFIPVPTVSSAPMVVSTSSVPSSIINPAVR